MAEIDRALGRLDELIAWAADHQPEIERNEAATRLHLIDGLLMHVLRWPLDQMQPEDPIGKTYADYVLGSPKRQLVVEAKREGAYFKLPPEAGPEASLETLFALDPALKPVVEQARGYAHDRGLPYAAVTNGQQFVVFLANRTDGVSPLKGRALALPSFESIREHFGLFWDALSRPGVEARRLTPILSGNGNRVPPMKLSSLIPGYPGLASSSGLEMDLNILGELFLIDLVDQDHVSEEFLKECYLDSGALSQYATVSKTILKSRYSEVLGQDLGVNLAPVRTRKGLAPELVADAAAASYSTRPIVLLGYVGVGKTLFIRHLVRVEAKDIFEKALVLYVNLGDEPALDDLEPFLAAHFISELRDQHGVNIFDRAFVRGVYNRDLEDFRSGVWGALIDSDPTTFRTKEIEHLAAFADNRESHLRRSLEHLAQGRGHQIVTILDNVDQRDSDFQDRVFLIAESLAKTWPGTVFVTLRPDTFNRSKRAGALSAYQPRVFAVAPPRVDLVLERRIAFARKQIERQAQAPASGPVVANVQDISDYLDVLGVTFRRDSELTAFLDNASGQNVRRALEIITTFIGSPHGEPARALKIRRERGRFVLPFHLLLRGVMLGQSRHYDPSSSLLPNVYDISTMDGREHFLMPIILAFLRQSAEPGVEHGYVGAARVYGHCQDLGFEPEQITWQLDRAVGTEMVEASPLDGVPELYRATSFGSYLESRLSGDFTYIDEVLVDVPIVDDTVRAVMEDVRATSARLDRCEGFTRYLDAQWHSLGSSDAGYDWAARSTALKAQMNQVRKRLEPPKPSPKGRARPRRQPGR